MARSFASSILVSLLLFTPLPAQSPPQKSESITYLQSLRTDGGGYAASKETAGKASLRATLPALRAIKYFGGTPMHLDVCANFARKCFDPATGGFADSPGGTADVPTTVIGLMTYVELKLPMDAVRDSAIQFLTERTKGFEEIRIGAAASEAIGKPMPKAQAWLAEIAKMRNPDGSFGASDGMGRATGSALAAILRLGAKIENEEYVRKILKNCQRADGGFGKEGVPGSDLETCYRVVRSFHMMKDKPDVERLTAFVGRCRNADGGYGVSPGQPSSAVGTYFAAIVIRWLHE